MSATSGTDPAAEPSAGYGRRVSGFAVDQAISGASNVLLVIAAARLLDTDGFARVSIVLLVYGFVVVVARSLIAIPVLMHPQETAAGTADVVRSSWTVGVLTAAIVAVGAVAMIPVDRPLSFGLAVLAVLAPALVVQDVGRFIAFSTRRIGRAIVLDVLWLVTAVVAITTIHLTASTSSTSFLAAWAGAGACAALAVHVYWPAAPRPGLAWLRSTRRASTLTFVESVILQLGALALVAVAGFFAGRQFIAGFSGAQVLARPITLLLQAMSASGVSEVAHANRGRGIVRATTATSAIATVGCGLVVGTLLLLPDRLGELVLGETWQATEVLLLPFAAYMLAEAVSCGPHAALRGLHRLTLLVGLSVAWSLIAIAATAIGYEAAGARGIIWGIAAARGAYVVALVACLVVALRRLPDTTSSDDELPDTAS